MCACVWTVGGVYVCLNVCIMYSHCIQLVCIQYPFLPWSKDYPHNSSVVEGLPSSRNQSFLGKAVCVLCFTWCTHSLSGVFFKISSIASQWQANIAQRWVYMKSTKIFLCTGMSSLSTTIACPTPLFAHQYYSHILMNDLYKKMAIPSNFLLGNHYSTFKQG